MSNSLKKTPIIGITPARSDKPYKQAEHSRERSAVKIALVQGRELPNSRSFGNPWSGEKDDKPYRPDCPEFLRNRSMHHKRGKPRNQRAGCKLCKPWKRNGWRNERPDGERFSDHRRRISR